MKPQETLKIPSRKWAVQAVAAYESNLPRRTRVTLQDRSASLRNCLNSAWLRSSWRWNHRDLPELHSPADGPA